MPKDLALITYKPFQHAITMLFDETARLQPMMQGVADKLFTRYENLKESQFVNYYDKSPRPISETDVLTLQGLYTIFLDNAIKKSKNLNDLIEKTKDPDFIKESIIIHIPAFLKMIGYAPNHSESTEEAVLSKLSSYAPIYGILTQHDGGRTFKSHYPIMNLVKHDARTITVEIMSPYMNAIIAAIVQASPKTDKNGKPKLKRNGEPFTDPPHTRLVKSSIISGRNKRAFSKAWQLLETKTKLKTTYKNIQFPTAIPTMSTLDMLFEFPHEGKIRKEEQA